MSEDVTEKLPFLSVFKYSCSFAGCDLEFKRKDRLDAHEFTHSNEKKFKCTEPNCNKAYVTNSNLQRHKQTAHLKSNEMVYCPNDSCGKYFDTEARLKAHCDSIHSEKPREFECEICNDKFRRKTQLKQHTFAHTGNYRFTCDKCGKGFLLMSRLKRHANSHRSRKCENCDATFEMWSLLLAHKNKEHVHSDLKCSICGREFNSMRILRNHRKIHVNLDDRPAYQCKFEGCSKVFLNNNNMLAHYKSKHENRLFACTYNGCTMELSTKQKLELHIKVIHLGESIKKPKIYKNRAERKDKGLQKKSTASKFFNIILPPEFERAIIAGEGKNIHIVHNPIEDGDDDAEKNGDFSLLATAIKLTEGVIEC